MLAMVTSWFTPTPLFLTINVVIATIFIISRFSHQKSTQTLQLGNQNSPQPIRAPSLLNRVKSFNFSFQSFDGHANLHDFDSGRSAQRVRAPSILKRVMSGNLSSLYNSEQTADSETEINRQNEPESRALKPSPEQKKIHEVRRSSPDSAGQISTMVPEKMTKSASEKLEKRKTEEREEIERRRPSTVKVDKRGSIGEVEDEIDAKADDFINKFKQTLKLQRLDSLLRVRNMLKGK